MKKVLHYQILPFNICGKIQEARIKTLNVKHLLQHGIWDFNLNYKMNHILCQVL